MLYRSCFLMFVFLFALLYVSAQEGSAIDSSYANGYYKQRLAFFEQMPNDKKEIIFLGNSITEAGKWQELIGGNNVKNRGISGDVTFGIRARLDEVLASKPLKIFLLIGINDMKRGIPVDSIASTYQGIIEKIRSVSPKTKLYIQSVLPVNEGMLSASYKNLNNNLIKALNQKLKALAENTGYMYVDLHGLMKDSEGQLARELTTDGIHLTPIAYIRWVQYIKAQNYL